MKHYRVIIEPEAGHDLENIYDFITQNDTPVKAQRFLRKRQEAIGSLLCFSSFFQWFISA